MLAVLLCRGRSGALLLAISSLTSVATTLAYLGNALLGSPELWRITDASLEDGDARGEYVALQLVSTAVAFLAVPLVVYLLPGSREELRASFVACAAGAAAGDDEPKPLAEDGDAREERRADGAGATTYLDRFLGEDRAARYPGVACGLVVFWLLGVAVPLVYGLRYTTDLSSSRR